MILAEIPLLPDTTDQLVDIVLSDNPYTLRVLWNEKFGYFSLSIFARDGAVILENIKMVKNSPLIGRFKNTLLPVGELFFVDNKNKHNRALYGSIGAGDYSLIYYVPDDVVTVETVVITPVAAVSGSIWDSGLSTWLDAGVPSTWDV
jgi:hypothetical protein